MKPYLSSRSVQDYRRPGRRSYADRYGVPALIQSSTPVAPVQVLQQQQQAQSAPSVQTALQSPPPQQINFQSAPYPVRDNSDLYDRLLLGVSRAQPNSAGDFLAQLGIGLAVGTAKGYNEHKVATAKAAQDKAQQEAALQQRQLNSSIMQSLIESDGQSLSAEIEKNPTADWEGLIPRWDEIKKATQAEITKDVNGVNRFTTGPNKGKVVSPEAVTQFRAEQAQKLARENQKQIQDQAKPLSLIHI